jgi:hypothetical protein
LNDIRIPKRFSLLGQTIDVELVDHLSGLNGTLGEARTFQNNIMLQKNVDGMPLPESQRVKIFWHEALHIILHNMGLNEEASDEKFVDLMAGMIYNVISTMEFDDAKPRKKTPVKKPPVKTPPAKKGGKK